MRKKTESRTETLLVVLFVVLASLYVSFHVGRWYEARRRQKTIEELAIEGFECVAQVPECFDWWSEIVRGF